MSQKHKWQRQNRFPILGKKEAYNLVKCGICKLTGRMYYSKPEMIQLGRGSIWSPIFCREKINDASGKI